MKNKGLISLSHVAAKACLSKAAVSMALRGDSSIPRRTQQRVQRIARELGYVRDHELASMMESVRKSGRFQQREGLAYLVFNGNNEHRPSIGSYENRLFLGAQSEALAQGYALDLVHVDRSELSDRRLSRILFHRGIRGLLIQPLRHSMPPLELAWKHFAVVALTATFKQPATHRVIPHHAQGMTLAMNRLKARAYERVGLVLPHWLDKHVGHAWKYTYQGLVDSAMNLAKIPVFLYRQSLGLRFDSWFARHRPQAILVGDNSTLQVLLDNPAMSGVRLVSLAGEESERGVWRVDQNPEQIGVEGARWLVSETRRSRFGLPKFAHDLLVRGSWLEG